MNDKQKANENYCNAMGQTIEQMDSEEFIDSYLVGEQFNIYLKDGDLWIDFISGVNYYGEINTSLQIRPDSSFRVERFGTSVGTFKHDSLYTDLMDSLYDIIER